MKQFINKIYRIVLQYIFSKIVKQGNNRGIADIYHLLYLAHEKEFPEDSDPRLFMIEMLNLSIDLKKLNDKIRANQESKKFDPRKFEGSISYDTLTGYTYKS